MPRNRVKMNFHCKMDFIFELGGRNYPNRLSIIDFYILFTLLICLRPLSRP